MSAIIMVYVLILFLTLGPLTTDSIMAQEEKPTLYDTNLKVTSIVEGLNTPTKMAFIGPDDILILEKDTGIVKRIVNGTVLEKPDFEKEYTSCSYFTIN